MCIRDSDGIIGVEVAVNQGCDNNLIRMKIRNHSKDLATRNYISKTVRKQTTKEADAHPFSIVSPNQKAFLHLTESLINSFPLKETEASSVEKSPITHKPIAHSFRGKNLADTFALKKSFDEVKASTLKAIASLDKPSQSIVNIMVAYISTMKVVESAKYKREYEKLKTTPKTYENIVKLLKSPEDLLKLAKELINNIADITLPQASHIIDIKSKYLTGADMRPNLISNKYQAARKLLVFLEELFNFVEVVAYTDCRRSLCATMDWAVQGAEKVRCCIRVCRLVPDAEPRCCRQRKTTSPANDPIHLCHRKRC
eukprot:TRINITY_DN7901_c0_g1_i8.p1 TRINITY_DN7901_c0_g1~~TRINITY_DN7901_c0_g1_i8.p1  ORF type:complete len:313 (+),score=24.03 TRINITY_DN7901_c0_g1_i8:71-1009(+)